MSTSIVFVDARVFDYQTLIAGLSTPAEVFVLDPNTDGVNQIAALLQGRTDIDALHIISHGSEGSVCLGSSVLDSQNISVGASGQLSTTLPDSNLALYFNRGITD